MRTVTLDATFGRRHAIYFFLCLASVEVTSLVVPELIRLNLSRQCVPVYLAFDIRYFLLLLLYLTITEVWSYKCQSQADALLI